MSTLILQGKSRLDYAFQDPKYCPMAVSDYMKNGGGQVAIYRRGNQ
jgi:hypothetical protein